MNPQEFKDWLLHQSEIFVIIGSLFAGITSNLFGVAPAASESISDSAVSQLFRICLVVATNLLLGGTVMKAHIFICASATPTQRIKRLYPEFEQALCFGHQRLIFGGHFMLSAICLLSVVAVIPRRRFPTKIDVLETPQFGYALLGASALNVIWTAAHLSFLGRLVIAGNVLCVDDNDPQASQASEAEMVYVQTKANKQALNTLDITDDWLMRKMEEGRRLESDASQDEPRTHRPFLPSLRRNSRLESERVRR